MVARRIFQHSSIFYWIQLSDSKDSGQIQDPFQVNFPGGNFGNRYVLWSWITGSMLPAYKALSDQNRDKILRDLSGLINDSAGVCK